MSVLPPGATNSNVPPCATASSPVRAAGAATSTASATSRCDHASRSVTAPAGSRVARSRPGWSPSKAKRGQRRQEHCRARGSCHSRLPLSAPAQRPDRQLVADAHRLVARAPAARARCTAASIRRGDLLVGLAPRRRERVAQLPPVPGIAQRAVARADTACPRRRWRPRSGRRRCRRQPVRGGDRRGGLLGALQRRGDHVDDVVGRPAQSATASACARPSSDRW